MRQRDTTPSPERQAAYRQRQAELMEALGTLHGLRERRVRQQNYYWKPKERLNAYLEMVEELIEEERLLPRPGPVE